MKRIIISALTILILLTATIAIIAYARGYRFNPKEKELAGTGLLVAKSEPDGAQVFINGELKSATNTTLNLDPNLYKVRIVKEGYQPWEKELPVNKEVVTRAEAILFPTNPGLTPLTNFGVSSPSLSPRGDAVAFVRNTPSLPTPPTATPASSGIYVLELASRPLSFSRNPRKIASSNNFGIWNLSASPAGGEFQISLTWSPDGDQLLAIFTNPKTEKQTAYLLNPNQPNQAPTPIDSISEIFALWKEQKEIDLIRKIETLPSSLIPIATSSAEIISFSPDESKILYRAKRRAEIPIIIKPPLIGTNPTPQTRKIEPGNLYVYDLKEDRNYLLPQNVDSRQSTVDQDLSLESSSLIWFPTSRHLLYVEDKKIKIMEYDAGNKTTLYAGPFEPSFLSPWPDGSKLVILTTLNPDADEALNLYAVKLR